MEPFEEIHQHPSAQKDGQADRRVKHRENTRPDAYVPTQIEAKRIWPLS
jgi:hypothetical protein